MGAFVSESISPRLFENIAKDVIIELPDGSKTFGKTINNNPEKFFTEDIMKQLDECAQKEFKYGNIEEIQVRPE